MATVEPQLDEQRDVFAILYAMVADSYRMADETQTFLRRWQKTMKLRRKFQFPAEFLAELSAVLRIASWQESGLAKELGAEFSPAEELLRGLYQRLFESPESFGFEPATCDAPLSREVMRIWWKRCSWSAPGILGVDAAVGQRRRDLQVDALVELLWSCRHLKSKGVDHAGTTEE